MDKLIDGSRFRLLVVDDTPANIEVLTQSLKTHGYKFAVANSGEKTLAIVEKVKPDLILLDVMMPGMTGYETCRKLKENPVTKDIPVIFITAKIDQRDINEGFRVGAVDYISKPFNDEEVHARVRTHLALKSAYDELYKLSEQKDLFLGMAAHDLRSPLGIAQGYAEIMYENDLGKEEQKKILENTIKVCSGMRLLVDDLLDISAISDGNISLELQKGDLVAIANRRVVMQSMIANKKNIKIVMESKEPLYCTIDDYRMEQVFDNLLTNAVKFSPPDTTIIVRATKNESNAEIEVIDQGPGFVDKDLENIFKEFQKLSARPTAGETSTGLGLAITKRVVDAHNGNISVKSNNDRGATFKVVIPLA